MKKLILLAIAFTFCFTTKAQTDSTQLAKNIIAAIKSENVENLQKLVAPPVVYREKFAETKGLTDKQIEEKTSKSPKLKADFENINKSAKTKKVELSKITYKSIVTEAMLPGVNGATITFTIGGKEGKLAISTLQHKGNWYLMEILISTGVFKDF